MASYSLGLCSFLVASMIIINGGASNEYKVGDADGWKIPAENDPGFYEKWASKIKFLIGDSIVFEYQNDSVVKVSKTGYYHCNETSRHPESRDGSTKFLLDKPGFYYFASGDGEHCKKGQRLMVEVIASPFRPPLGPAPSPLPSMGATCTVSTLLTVVVIGTLLGFIH